MPAYRKTSSRSAVLVTLAATLSVVIAGLSGSVGRLTGSWPAAAQAANQEFASGNVCIGCHTPANGPLLSGMQLGRWLGPNITPDRVSGIGAWSRDEVFRYLRY